MLRNSSFTKLQYSLSTLLSNCPLHTRKVFCIILNYVVSINTLRQILYKVAFAESFRSVLNLRLSTRFDFYIILLFWVQWVKLYSFFISRRGSNRHTEIQKQPVTKTILDYTPKEETWRTKSQCGDWDASGWAVSWSGTCVYRLFEMLKCLEVRKVVKKEDRCLFLAKLCTESIQGADR